MILSFVLGGGTFDATILDVVVCSDSSVTFNLKAVSGDGKLGGQDFDNLLIGHSLKEMESQYGQSFDTNEKVLGLVRLSVKRC